MSVSGWRDGKHPHIRASSSPNMCCRGERSGLALIADFDLTIRKSSESQLISTCFPGLRKTSPLAFTVHRSNFKPTEILRVLYLDPFKQRDRSGGFRLPERKSENSSLIKMSRAHHAQW